MDKFFIQEVRLLAKNRWVEGHRPQQQQQQEQQEEQQEVGRGPQTAHFMSLTAPGVRGYAPGGCGVGRVVGRLHLRACQQLSCHASHGNRHLPPVLLLHPPPRSCLPAHRSKMCNYLHRGQTVPSAPVQNMCRAGSLCCWMLLCSVG